MSVIYRTYIWTMTNSLLAVGDWSSMFQLHFFSSSEPLFSQIFLFHPSLFLAIFFHWIQTYFQPHFFHFIWTFSITLLHFTHTYFLMHFFISSGPIFSHFFSFYLELFSAAFLHFMQAYFQPLFQLSSAKFSDKFPDFWMFHLTWWPILDNSIPGIPHYSKSLVSY